MAATAGGMDVRMLVNEACRIVYFVMDDKEEVLRMMRPTLTPASS